MPILSGIAAVLLLVFILMGTVAVIIGLLVMPVIQNMLDRPRPQRAVSEWDDDDEEPVQAGRSEASPAEVHVWWSAGDSPAETFVVGGSQRAGATAVAERPTKVQQIWTIHPDHTSHWQDEAGDCKWCRADPL